MKKECEYCEALVPKLYFSDKLNGWVCKQCKELLDEDTIKWSFNLTRQFL
jgi:hypothetical protein